METVLDKIRAKAKTLGRKICLTESDDPRNLKAAEIMAHIALDFLREEPFRNAVKKDFEESGL